LVLVTLNVEASAQPASNARQMQKQKPREFMAKFSLSAGRKVLKN
jgi:hypothetical protein